MDEPPIDVGIDVLKRVAATLARSSAEVRKALALSCQHGCDVAFHEEMGTWDRQREPLQTAIVLAAECLRGGKLFDVSTSLNDINNRTSDAAVEMYEQGLLRPPFPLTAIAMTLSLGLVGVDIGVLVLIDADTDTLVVFTVDPRKPQWMPAVLALTDDRKRWRFVPAGAPESLRRVIVSALLVIADSRIAVHLVEPDEKLNKARVRNGKSPLSSYWRVNPADIRARYVTRLDHHVGSTKGSGGGGHHASPCAHQRRGHPRKLRSGKTVWVRDAMVGELVKRLRRRDHYELSASTRRSPDRC